MEWLLLYPLIGVLVFPWFYRNEKRYHKREDRFNGIQNLLGLVILWPLALWFSPQDWKKGAQELEAKREREFLELETRVRREDRARTRREFAEFDKELLADKYERTEDGKGYKIPDGSMSFDQMGTMFAEMNTLTRPPQPPTSWDEEQLERIEYAKRLGKMILNRSLPNYSKGGRIGT